MAADVRKYTADVRKYGADIRKTLEGALGNLSPAGARDLARSMVEQAQELKGKPPTEVAGQAAAQVRELAQQLLDWSQQGREWFLGLIQREVRRQMKQIGVVTSDDLDALRKRVRDLEKATGGGSTAKRSSTSRAKRSAAKKPASRSTAPKTSGSSSGGTSSGGSSSGDSSEGGSSGSSEPTGSGGGES